jgi:beta-glucuronidase
MLYPQDNEIRQFKDLGGLWKFFIPPAAEAQSLRWAEEGLPADAREVAVPASFNDLFTDADIREHVGAVWYETEFFVPSAWRDLWVGLRFDSVTHHAQVWINGQPAFQHKGGFLPFGGDVRRWVEAGKPNRLTVRVDNLLNWTTLPTGEMGTTKDAAGNDRPTQVYHFDFFNYAGIDRPVRLVAHGEIHVAKLRLTPVHRGEEWGFAHKVTLAGADAASGVRVEVRYLDESGQEVARANGADGETVIPSPRLWRPQAAYLYTAEVRVLGAGGELLDLYRDTCGLREIEVTEKHFLINGEPFYFRGFGKHEDFAVIGKGLNLPLLVRDFELLEWIGANSVRTSHYPYSEEFMRMADRRGIVVIDECPAVGMNRFKGSVPVFNSDEINGETLAHHRQVMEDLIERDYNRPCVVMWSVANEPASGDPESENYFREIFAHTRACDPTRPVTLVETTWWDRTLASQFSDVICINRYFGWYINMGNLDCIAAEMEQDLRNWHAKFHKPVLVAEYGADTIAGLRSLPAQPFSEDFQKEFLDRYHEAFDRCDFCVGEHVWNFADFMTKVGLTRIIGNRKGVFTRDRHPKAVAYALRDRWTARDR